MTRVISVETSRKLSWMMFSLSILIVLRHNSGYDSYVMGAGLFDAVAVQVVDIIRYKGVFNFVLPIFSAISGFLFYRNYSYIHTCDKWKSRIHTLVIPYLAWNTFWLLVMALFEKIPFIFSRIDSMERFSFSLKSILEGIFLYQYNPSFWFVFQLILYTVGAPLIFTLIKNRIIGGSILIGGFVIYSFNINTGFIRMDSLLFYLIGAFLSLHVFSIINYRFTKSQFVLALFVLIATIAVYSMIDLKPSIDFLLTIVQMYCVWCLGDIFIQWPVKWWTKIHFFIYGLHQITQLCVNKLVSLWLPSHYFMLVNFFGGAFIALMICVLVALILKKYCKPLWIIFNGGR